MSALTTGLREGADQLKKSFRNTPVATRKFLADPKSAVGGASLLPLIVLLGHTFIDALDGAGFVVILPEIQKDFDLKLSEVSSIGALALFVGLLLSIPVAVKSEATTRRTLYLGAGAVIAAIFSFVSGISFSLGLFLLSRAGFGMGLRLNDPVQQSLLSDYYPVHTRSTVFAARDGFTRAGRLIGPVFFGLVTLVFGWRAALIAVAVPSALLAYFSFRLPNPVRGAPEREAAGLPPLENEEIKNPPTLREAFRILNKIGTVRRLWYSLPFIAGGLLALAIMLPLFMEEQFGLEAAGRGFVSAAGEAGAIVGLLMMTPVMTRYLTGGSPERIFPFMSANAIVLSVLLALTAAVPNTFWLVVMIVVVNFTGAVLAPALAVLISMVVPPRVRTISFATVALFIIPGLFVLPIATGIGDTHGVRWTLLFAAPMFLVGALILTTSGKLFKDDLQRAFEAMAAEFATSTPTIDAEDPAIPAEPVITEPAAPKAKKAPAKKAAAAKKAPAKKTAAKKPAKR